MFKVILVAFALLAATHGQLNDWFKTCNNGWQSYFKTGRCDGIVTCFDGSDEWNCGGGQAPTTTKAPRFLCNNGWQSIPLYWKCDDMFDCDDRSDEMNCGGVAPTTKGTPAPPTSAPRFLCNDGVSIPLNWKCDDMFDCDDRSDEMNCGGVAPTPKPTPAPPTPAPPTPAPPTPAPPGPSGCSCGCTPIEPIGDVAGIIGGQVAKPNSWPWQIWLTIKVGSGSYSTCGGSFIDENWVLTAGHCLKSDSSLSDYTIHAGMFKTWYADKEIGVSSVHPHPDYPDYPVRANPKNPYVGGLDVALIKLSSPVTFNDKMQKVCLPKNDQEEIVENTKMTVTGWGGVSVTSKQTSETLKQVTLDVKGSADGYCEPKEEICTAGPNSGQATYLGDSGGPLIRKKGTNWYQYGVVSGFVTWTNGMQLGKFARISVHCDWIQKTTNINICK